MAITPSCARSQEQPSVQPDSSADWALAWAYVLVGALFRVSALPASTWEPGLVLAGRTPSASWWLLSVDGLLLLATVGLLKSCGPRTRRARGAVWLAAFLLGIAISPAGGPMARRWGGPAGHQRQLGRF